MRIGNLRRRAEEVARIGLVALAVFGCREPREPSEPLRQVILIVLDAARADRFSAYGYARETTPRMDEIARDGWLFEQAFSAATDTRNSIPALLFSRHFSIALFPDNPNVPLREPSELFQAQDDQAISLPRALGREGLRTVAFSAHPWIGERTPFADEFDEMHDLGHGDHDPRYGYPLGEDVIDRVIPWLGEHVDEEYFLYLHLMDTHFPHFLGEDARSFWSGSPPEGFTSGGRPIDRSKALEGDRRAYLDALYDGSLRYTDRQVGRLVDALRELDRLQDTLIVITADHGEALLEMPGRFEHGGPWLDATSSIPLLVHYPTHVAPARVDALVGMVDVAPTVLGLLDLELPADRSYDGRDLTPIATGSAPAPTYVLSALGVRSEHDKLTLERGRAALLTGDGADPPDGLEGSLYDLGSDPEERRDLWDERPERVRELLAVYRDALRERFARHRAATTEGTPSGGFAISSRHLTARPAISMQRGRPRPADGGTPGWSRSTHWWTHWIEGTAGAQPVSLSVRIPDGVYDLSLRMRGSAEVDVGGRRRTVEAGGRGAASSLETTRVPFGTVTVTDKQFVASLRPVGDGVLLRFLSFEPTGMEAPHIDTEALRALGYVH